MYIGDTVLQPLTSTKSFSDTVIRCKIVVHIFKFMTNITGFPWISLLQWAPRLLPCRGLDPLGPFLLHVRWKGHLRRIQKQESGIWLPPVEEACHLDATGGSHIKYVNTVWFTTFDTSPEHLQHFTP